MKILYISDVFGESAVVALENFLPKFLHRHRIDFVILQAENVSDRKGFIEPDYLRLKKIGVDAFTIGNHVWAKPEIKRIINNPDIIRPYNVSGNYEGLGTRVFKVKGKTVRVSQLMGISFNELKTGWKQNVADNFFDALDELILLPPTDYHIVDFHGETTSEKKVFGLYADGKVNAVIGTHTHVQTNDAITLPKGTAYITDLGMTGPINSAIGADYQSVYEKMRYGGLVKFAVSPNPIQLNAAILHLKEDETTIEIVNKNFK